MKNITLLLLFFFSFISSYAQLTEIKSVKHTCGGNTGEIEMEILQPDDLYYFEWDSGHEDLKITDLGPGTYTFTAYDLFGCKEEHEIEILDISDCYSTYEIEESPRGPCFVNVRIRMFNQDGIELPESLYTSKWDDDVTGNLRLFHLSEAHSHCVVSTIVECCAHEVCFSLIADINCPPFGFVVVNEMYKDQITNSQFSELLVLGNGNCGESTDIREYIVDDNDGNLIQGNHLINESNLNKIGINSGYLRFNNHAQWASIPNGSLIVLHDGLTANNFPIEDPFDSDNDGVYVINVDNDYGLLGAYETNWKNDKLNYLETTIDKSYDVIQLTESNDGLQVKNPIEGYIHGLSIGQTFYVSENNFDLWFSNQIGDSYSIQQLNDAFYVKEAFDYEITMDTLALLASPGVGNTIENQSFVANLLDCGFSTEDSYQSPIVQRSTTKVNNEFSVYPNPFTNELTIELNSGVVGEHTISLLSLEGRTILKRIETTTERNTKIPIQLGSEYYSGIYLVKVEFANGDIQHTKVIKFN